MGARPGFVLNRIRGGVLVGTTLNIWCAQTQLQLVLINAVLCAMASRAEHTRHILIVEKFDVSKSVVLRAENDKVSLTDVAAAIGPAINRIKQIGNDFLIEFKEAWVVDELGQTVHVGEEALVVSIPENAQTAPIIARLESALHESEEKRKEEEQRHLEERRSMEERLAAMEELIRTFSSQSLTAQAPPNRESATRSGDNSRMPQPDLGSATRVDAATRDDTANRDGQTIRIPITSSAKESINVQVEHVIKSDRDHSIQHRLRPFSGNAPKSGEVDFEEWVRQVELVLEDDSSSDRYKKQKLLSSLHTPALDLARSLGDVSAQDLFKHLEGLYGSTTNGVKLLHEFFKMQPGQGEKSTDFLQRLGVKLNKVAKKGAIQESQVNETLLTHFKATCADDRLSSVLHVKFDHSKPPTFQDLMREVKRIEELNITQRRDLSRCKTSQSHTSQVLPQAAVDPTIRQMRDRMDTFERNLQEWTTSISQSIQNLHTSAHSTPRATPTVPQGPHQDQSYPCQSAQHYQSHGGHRPYPRGNQRWTRRDPQPNQRARICYNCGGEDGHFARDCNNSPNPVLVHEKLNPRRMDADHQKQQHLNGERPSTL